MDENDVAEEYAPAGYVPIAAHALVGEALDAARARVTELEAELAESQEGRIAALNLWRMSVHGVSNLNDLPGGPWEATPAAETTSGGAWKYGDLHRCGASSYPHTADTECVSYALKHGDTQYRPD